MSSGLWREGREAWERLSRRSASGDGALDALSDVAAVRRLLDRAELEAVRQARQARRSWSEIATRLGVTRQSAWERWRDLDEEPTELAEHLIALEQVAVDELMSGRGVVAVPNVVGMSWARAQRRMQEFDLHAVSADPQLTALVGPDALDVIVLDQKPAAGERAPAHSAVTVWVRRGPGSAGVRAPLPPPPGPRAQRGRIDEETGDSVRS